MEFISKATAKERIKNLENKYPGITTYDNVIVYFNCEYESVVHKIKDKINFKSTLILEFTDSDYNLLKDVQWIPFVNPKCLVVCVKSPDKETKEKIFSI